MPTLFVALIFPAAAIDLERERDQVGKRRREVLLAVTPATSGCALARTKRHECHPDRRGEQGEGRHI